MLLRFRFANYRSFRAEQELSMVASTALTDSAEGVIQAAAVPDGVLPVAALYGANASGKSNVLRAFEFMLSAVQNSFRTWLPDGPIPYDPFALDRDRPSRFEVDFLVEGVRYPSALARNDPPALTKTDPPEPMTMDRHARCPEKAMPDLPPVVQAG